MIAAIADGRSCIANYSSAADCRNTIECLSALGVRFGLDDDVIAVDGVGLKGLRVASGPLDAGNSGSTMRMLSGVLAGQAFTTVIDGDESLRHRPMGRIIEPLTLMGARIEARDGSFAPLSITGGGLHGIEYTPPVASAQVKSAVLLAGLFAKGTTTVIERTPTRDHTEIMLRQCEAQLSLQEVNEGTRISLSSSDHLKPLGDYTVPGDISSAAFFLVAGLIVPDSQMHLEHIGVNPSRRALIDVLREMGGRIDVGNVRLAHGEEVGDLTASTSRLAADVRLHGAIIANLIDEIPVLAIAATQMEGRFVVREAGELRIKESDRIRSIIDNLRLMGVDVDEFQDGFALTGPQTLTGAQLQSNGDHRIAMAFTVAGLVARGATTIEGADAAAVSLPEFFDLLRKSGATISSI